MIGDGAGRRPWVYVASQAGRFQRLHRVSGAVLIALYLLAPWLSVGDHRLVYLDLPNRRFYLFGAVFTAVDTQFLLLLLLLASFGLLLFTALLGRVWCGYLCPQTVFLEEWIRPVERLIEGNRGARRRLDQGRWTGAKLRKKAVKWTLFAAMSFVLAMTFVAYFVPSAGALWTFSASRTTWAFVGAIAVVTFLDLAWFREQFCNYLCPYARLQGALCDAHTLTIGYDRRRGEPRGAPKTRAQRLAGAAGAAGAASEAGDAGAAVALQGEQGLCVDCNKCVVVCPNGIDIRDGFQLECITCGHCIDACEEVMRKQGTLPSLVAYTTEARLEGSGRPARRGRAWVYGLAFAALLAITVGLLLGRSAIDASVVRAPGMPYAVRPDGRIQNVFRAHLMNNDLEPRVFALEVAGIAEMEVILPVSSLEIAGGEERTLPVFVLVDPVHLRERATDIEFVIRAGDEEVRRSGTFQSGVAPRGRGVAR
jgi:cytochrome c oxidase accessory protein FixG